MCLQELPCEHPIVTSYWADMQQRYDLAAMALKPQGNRLLDISSSSSSRTKDHGDVQVVVRGNGWVVVVDKRTGGRHKLVCSSGSSSTSCALFDQLLYQHLKQKLLLG